MSSDALNVHDALANENKGLRQKIASVEQTLEWLQFSNTKLKNQNAQCKGGWIQAEKRMRDMIVELEDAKMDMSSLRNRCRRWGKSLDIPSFKLISFDYPDCTIRYRIWDKIKLSLLRLPLCQEDNRSNKKTSRKARCVFSIPRRFSSNWPNRVCRDHPIHNGKKTWPNSRWGMRKDWKKLRSCEPSERNWWRRLVLSGYRLVLLRNKSTSLY